MVGGALLCGTLAPGVHALDAAAIASAANASSAAADGRVGLSVTQRLSGRWPGPATETMLWAGQGPVAAGVGLLQVPQSADGNPPAAAWAGGPTGNETAWLLGIAVAPDEHTRLSWQTTLAHASPDPALAGPPSMRLGLAFKVRDPLAELRRGTLMELEFSAQTQLSLRPNSGHLGLSLNSRW
jgi:hypothetical protein